jgi:outer membrane protein TolC
MELMLDELAEQLEMVRAKVSNGLLLPGNELVLKAEQIKTSQNIIEIEAGIRSGYRILGEILGMPVEPNTTLKIPELPEIIHQSEGEGNRAEYRLFDLGIRQLNTQKELTSADKWPTVSAFAQTAYGRPGLNAFDDDLQFYWKIGLTARWSLKSWSNSLRNMDILENRKRVLDADRDAFTRQLNIQLRQKEEQIIALDHQLRQEEELLDLHRQIVDEKRNLLEEGVIHSTEYVTVLNTENRARIDLEMRQLNRIQIIAEHATQQGILWN